MRSMQASGHNCACDASHGSSAGAPILRAMLARRSGRAAGQTTRGGRALAADTLGVVRSVASRCARDGGVAAAPGAVEHLVALLARHAAVSSGDSAALRGRGCCNIRAARLDCRRHSQQGSGDGWTRSTRRRDFSCCPPSAVCLTSRMVSRGQVNSASKLALNE